MKFFNHIAKEAVLFPRPQTNSLPSVIWVGYEHRGLNSIVEWDEHPQQFVFYIKSGTGMVTIGDITMNLNPGDCLHYPMKTSTRLEVTSPEGMEMLAVTFVGVNARKDLGIRGKVFKPVNGVAIEEFMQFIVKQALIRGQSSHKLINSLLPGFLQLVKEGVANVETDTSSLKMQTFLRIRRYMDSNFIKTATVEEIARKHNLSSEYIIREFKIHSGQTPLQYLHQLKISQACQWILEGNMKIAEIAVALQYSTSSSFARRFRQITGYSPREYRARSLQ